MGIVLGAAGVVMRGLQWHYDKLADEFRGHPRVTSTDVSGVVRAPAPAEVDAQPAQARVAPGTLAARGGQG